jgi:hypothetical protein
MCDPITMTMASVGIGGLQTALQFEGQRSYALAQAAAIRQATINTYTQGQQTQVYQNEQAFQKLKANQRALRSAQGTMQDTASANGVGGQTISALSNELDANAGSYASDVQYNRDASDEEIQMQLKGAQDQAQSSLNMIPQPNPLAIPMAIGGGAFSAYSRFFPKTGLQ